METIFENDKIRIVKALSVYSEGDSIQVIGKNCRRIMLEINLDEGAIYVFVGWFTNKKKQLWKITEEAGYKDYSKSNRKMRWVQATFFRFGSFDVDEDASDIDYEW